MKDVANHGAAWRRDHPDHGWQKWQELFPRLIEKSFGGELSLALFKKRHKRADAGGLQCIYDDLILRAARVSRQPAYDDDFKSRFQFQFNAQGGACPDYPRRAGAA